MNLEILVSVLTTISLSATWGTQHGSKHEEGTQLVSPAVLPLEVENSSWRTHFAQRTVVRLVLNTSVWRAIERLYVLIGDGMDW